MSAALLSPPPLLSPEEFALRPDADRYELIDGQLVEREMSNATSLIGGEFHRHMGNWSVEGGGKALPDNTTYACFPRRPKLVRKPDVSFFTAERWSPTLLDATDIALAPDLIVEVMSPNDSGYDLTKKINEFFRAGTLEAWIVHPATDQLERRFRNGDARWLEADETLDGAPLLPGFTLRLADVLAVVR